MSADTQDDEVARCHSDDLLEATVGDFGRWQCFVSVLMALLKLPIAWFSLSIVFLAPSTQFWCTNPQRPDLSTPNDSTALRKEGLNVGYCTMIDLYDGNRTVPCPNGYTYNTSVFSSTIVTEWHLVCGRQTFIDLTQVTFVMGTLIGNIVFGVLADKRGRKPVLIACILLQSVFGVAASFMPWYWLFLLCRFLLAVFNGGTIVTSFVMCMEVVGGEWRTIVPILYQIPFGFGNSLMALLAYFVRDWRSFHLALSLLACPYALYYFCLPESPRWLLAVGRDEEAVRVLSRAAKFNETDQRKIQTVMTELSNVRTKRKEEKRSSCLVLFSTPQLRMRSILLCLNWTICGMTFFAFSQLLGHVSGDVFFTVATGGLIVIPGTFLCVYLVGRCGRKVTVACGHVVTGFCFLAILSVPKGAFVQDWPRVAFAAVGIVGMSVSMPALYLFTGELYPTITRNAGVGSSLMFSRLGSMVAPLIVSLQGVEDHLPLGILAVCAFIETALVLPLPETKGKALAETVQDLEKIKDIDSELERRHQDYFIIPNDASKVEENDL